MLIQPYLLIASTNIMIVIIIISSLTNNVETSKSYAKYTLIHCVISNVNISEIFNQYLLTSVTMLTDLALQLLKLLTIMWTRTTFAELYNVGNPYHVLLQSNSFIHFLVILLVVAASDVIHPLLVFEIPFYGLFDALFELQ